MNLYICGLLDIILVLCTALFIFIGFKVGFIKKALSLFSVVMIIIFAIIYCGQFAKFLIAADIFYSDIYNPIFDNVMLNLTEKGIPSDANLVQVISTGIGLPEWLAGFIENAVVNTGLQLDNVETMVHGLCEYVATSVMNVIAFGVIVIGVTILQVILKIFAELLRKNELFRTIDGVLGAIFFLGIYATVVSVVFMFLAIFMNQPWFADAAAWLKVDMQLESDAFRISKAVYEGNLLKNIIDLFIG